MPTKRRALIVLLFSAFLPSAKAQTLPQNHNFDALVETALAPMKEYFIDIKNKKVMQLTANGKRADFMYSGSIEPALTIVLEQSEKNGVLRDVLYFSSWGAPAGKAIFEREGQELEAFTLLELLGGHFPKCGGCTYYYSKWDPFNLEVRRSTVGESTTSRLFLYGNILQYSLEELRRHDRVTHRTSLHVYGKQEGATIQVQTFLQGGQWETNYHILPGLNAVEEKYYKQYFRNF